MKKFFVLAIAGMTLAPTTASSENFSCARVFHESFLSSEGKLGIFLPALIPISPSDSIDERPRFTEVEPGECYYEEALQSMRSMCSILNDLPQIDPPAAGGETPGNESSYDNEGVGSGGQDSLESVQKLKASVAKLKKRVRTLRRKLYSKGSY